MKNNLLLFAMMLLPLVASAHDIEVQNADGVTIYYNYINDGTELEVTFRGSSDNYYSNEYQGNVVIPEEVTYMNRTRKVTSIEGRAFYDCKGLTSITIPNSVTSIGDYAFWKCFGLTSIAIGSGVTSIGNGAFDSCYGLTSVTIPNSVTSIGEHAFSNCYGLTSITIGSGVTSIGNYAFIGCSGLKKVIVKDIAAWCGIKFDGSYSNPLDYAKHIYSDEDTEITNLIIPNSVTSIGNYAFDGCSGLTSVTIPNSVTSIGEKAFLGCSGLTSITIPNSVTSIGWSAFSGCSGLTSVTIPNSVTSIGWSAFYGCSGLTSVTIGSGVTSIGGSAFNGADIPTIISLIENPFKITEKTSDSRTFTQNTFNNATLYVPKGTIDKYKATDGWKDFLFIEEGTGGGDTPTTQKCEKPTISYENGKLTFTSETEGAVCQYSITDTDIKAGSGNEVQLGVTYNISVFAAKAGYENSETATATLCWIDQQPKTEGINNGIANVAAQAVLIQSEGGSIKVQGVDEGTQVNVYGINGTQAGSAISQSGAATINTNLQPGSVAIVKIGQKSVKVVIK